MSLARCILPFIFLYAAEGAEWVFRHDNILGTSMELRVTSLTLEEAKQVESAILEEIDRLNGILSAYDSSTSISKFLQAPLGIPQYVPTELMEIFVACDWWRTRTNGVFNPLVEESSRLWREGERNNSLPSPSHIESAVARIAGSAWRVQPDFESVTRTSDSQFSVDGIAKGFIIDRVCEAAWESATGTDSILLSIGGDIRVIGSVSKPVSIADPANPSENAPPLHRLSMKSGAIATSANYSRSLSIGGKEFSHIIDPRTGYPVSGSIESATVIAANATQADALATTLMILPSQESVALIESLPETECLIVTSGMKMLTSSGFDAFVAKDLLTDGPDDATWPSGFRLLVDFEINRPDSRRYERPFVAIWVEDEQGAFVANLCVWAHTDTKYIRKLSRWNRIKDKNWKHIDSVTRATRSPGKYTVFWDGSDASGKIVPQGNYAILIEAVREHGTYGLIRQEFSASNTPFVNDLDGNLEIRSATLRYEKTRP